MALTYGIGIIPWSPLAGGKLTGKYARGKPAPDNSRETPETFTASTWSALEGLAALARDKGCTLTALSLAWNVSQPGVTSPIIGPNSVGQLEANLASLSVRLTEEDHTRIDTIVPPGTHTEDYYRAEFGPHPHRI